MQSTTMQKSRKKRLMGQALEEIQVFLVRLFLKSTSQLATTYKRTITLTPVCQSLTVLPHSQLPQNLNQELLFQMPQ